MPGHQIKRILSFETPSSTEWQISSCGREFWPNCYIGIEDQLERKLAALQVYESEIRDWPHSRSIKSVEFIARTRGSQVGFEAAESFMLIREIY